MSRIEPVRLGADFDRIQRIALIAGAVGLVLSALGYFLDAEQFFRSYLFAYLFWLGLGMGSFAATMLQHLTGGRWGLVIRRLLESGALTLPVLALLFLPLVFGLGDLYEWTHQDVVDNDPILKGKQPYLNVPFFLIRAALYFAIWVGLAWLLNRWSEEQDRTANPHIPRRFRLLSGPGLMLYVLTMSFAAFDWAMSLEPHWYSTIYGVIFIVSQVLTTLAFVIVVMSLLAPREPLGEVMTVNIFHDLGNLMLAFTMLWAYMSFSQFIIIWSANLPEEVVWYLRRISGAWKFVPVVLLIFHFALPFVLLLIRNNKRRPAILARIAGFLFLIHFVNMFWLIMPAFYQTGFHISWLDVVAPIGIGGIWIAAYIWALKRKPLIAVNDHRWLEDHGHHE